jgi:hypothetical protein
MTILLYITGITVWTNHTEISPSDISKYLNAPSLIRERLRECKHVFSRCRLEITSTETYERIPKRHCLNILKCLCLYYHQKQLTQTLHNSHEDDRESKEPDYDDNEKSDKAVEEKQEKETGEMTTVNQVF